MKDAPPAASSGFDGPAIYRISVKGRIAPKWRDRLEGMVVTEWTAEGVSPRTTLLGELADQAALAGVLDTLIRLHLTIASVECLSTE